MKNSSLQILRFYRSQILNLKEHPHVGVKKNELKPLEIIVDVEIVEVQLIVIEVEVEAEISEILEGLILNLKIIEKIKANVILVENQAIQEQIQEIIQETIQETKQEIEDVKI